MTKFSEIKVGDILIADKCFCCLEPGEECEVKLNLNDGLYVDCNHGQHYLDGQLDAENKLVGFTAKLPLRKDQLWDLCEEFIKERGLTLEEAHTLLLQLDEPENKNNKIIGTLVFVAKICKIMGYSNVE